MDAVNSKDLNRNPKIITDKLKAIGNTMKTSANMRILVYDTYVSKGISILDNVCNIVGVLAILDDKNNYGVLTIPGIINVEPNEISSMEIDGELYHVLEIAAGELLISDTNIVKDTDFVYKIFEATMLRGKVPFFLEYEDMVKVFTKFYRNTITKQTGNPKPRWVGFMDIYYSFSSTISKVVGSYFKTGVLVANINKQKEPTKLEKVLRA